MHLQKTANGRAAGGMSEWDPDGSLLMLILTRRTGETLRIGDDVEVTVMAVNGLQVRIGIKAPRNVAVDRLEIAERKQREREAPP
jgi:carbon storage regulator